MKKITFSQMIVAFGMMFSLLLLSTGRVEGNLNNPIVSRAIQLARSVVGAPFSANAHGDPQPSKPPTSFVCSSFVMWVWYEASDRLWVEWRPSDTILAINGLLNRQKPPLVRFFAFASEEDLRPGDLLYRSPHARNSGESRPRDFFDEAGEVGFNEADPRHDYHHVALYLGHGEVIQAAGDRRGDVVIAGPRSYGVRITRFDPGQWSPEAGRPRRLTRN